MKSIKEIQRKKDDVKKKERKKERKNTMRDCERKEKRFKIA